MSEIGPTIYSQTQDKVSSSESSHEINWKNALVETNPLSISHVKKQKAHALFTRNLRELCPETEWIFIRDEQFSQNEETYLNEIENAFKAMVSLPEWPFPERILVTIQNHEIFRTWNFSIPSHQGNFPSIDFGETLVMTHYTDINFHGIKFNLLQSFGTTRSGEA